MRVQFSSAAPICLPRLKPLQMQTFFKSSAAHLFPYVSATTIANTIIIIIIIIITITNTIIIININTTVTTITTTATVATIAITTTTITITTINTAATLIALPDNEMQRRII